MQRPKKKLMEMLHVYRVLTNPRDIDRVLDTMSLQYHAVLQYPTLIAVKYDNSKNNHGISEVWISYDYPDLNAICSRIYPDYVGTVYNLKAVAFRLKLLLREHKPASIPEEYFQEYGELVSHIERLGEIVQCL